MKANPMPAVVQHLAHRIDRIDVASGLELLDGAQHHHPGRQGQFRRPGEVTGRNPTGGRGRHPHRDRVDHRVLPCDPCRRRTRTDAERRSAREPRLRRQGIRDAHGRWPAAVRNRRGARARRCCANTPRRASNLLGFHVFAGSQNLNAAIIAEAQRRTVDLVSQLAEHLPTPVRYLNLGGGFGIPYVEADRPLDLAAVAGNLHDLVDGPIAAADAGGQSGDRARPLHRGGMRCLRHPGARPQGVPRQDLPVVDGGMHHQLAASGNFGQAIRRNYPVSSATVPMLPSTRTPRSWAASARRSTFSVTTSNSRRQRSTT